MREYTYKRNGMGFMVEYAGDFRVWTRIIPEGPAALPRCGKHDRLDCPECYAKVRP